MSSLEGSLERSPAGLFSLGSCVLDKGEAQECDTVFGAASLSFNYGGFNV